MEQLPDEILYEVFRRVPIADCGSLALVNRRFGQITARWFDRRLAKDGKHPCQLRVQCDRPFGIRDIQGREYLDGFETLDRNNGDRYGPSATEYCSGDYAFVTELRSYAGTGYVKPYEKTTRWHDVLYYSEVRKRRDGSATRSFEKTVYLPAEDGLYVQHRLERNGECVYIAWSRGPEGLDVSRCGFSVRLTRRLAVETFADPSTYVLRFGLEEQYHRINGKGRVLTLDAIPRKGKPRIAFSEDGERCTVEVDGQTVFWTSEEDGAAVLTYLTDDGSWDRWTF